MSKDLPPPVDSINDETWRTGISTIEEVLDAAANYVAFDAGVVTPQLNRDEALSQLNRIIALREQFAYEAGVDTVNVPMIEAQARLDERRDIGADINGNTYSLSLIHITEPTRPCH
jgi:hypothetical protein